MIVCLADCAAMRPRSPTGTGIPTLSPTSESGSEASRLEHHVPTALQRQLPRSSFHRPSHPGAVDANEKWDAEDETPGRVYQYGGVGLCQVSTRPADGTPARVRRLPAVAALPGDRAALPHGTASGS